MPLDLKSRQIVVGISISDDSEPYFREDLPIIPAILDTGFNKTFSIHQFFLEQSAHIAKDYLAVDNPADGSETTYQDHPYDTCYATLWLHRSPFAPNATRTPARRPLRLGKSNRIFVFKYKQNQNHRNVNIDDIYPRMPLLGMQALMANKLRHFVDGERSSFRISRSFRSWLYAEDRS
jgi:hypothetical protein